MKGVILAGGTGTRLAPLTAITNKHLLPVYDRPMIRYPLETLKAFGVEDILIVSGGEHIGAFAEYLGDGKQLGVSLTYRVQHEPRGIAHALSFAQDFALGERLLVILGDNVFDLRVAERALPQEGACIWVKQLQNAKRFGVLSSGKESRIIEKPRRAAAGRAVTGLYLYPPDVFDVIKKLRPSKRGEYEITDVNNHYLFEKRCSVRTLDKKLFWSDAGTFPSLLAASIWAAQERGR